MINVTESDFSTAVIERSATVPVVVDFWAEWCGPCRQLGPLIERAVEARNGQVELAKVDVDSNPNLARTFGIQGIPAVKAFKDRRVVSEFVGVKPATAIEQFLDELAPSEAEALIAAGDETSLRRAVELEPHRADAVVPLARILHARGEGEAALALLREVPGSFAADGLAARIRLEDTAPPADLGSAFAALDSGDNERGLDELLAALPESGGHLDDIRRIVIGVLDELGVEHPLARDTRRRLAAALY